MESQKLDYINAVRGWAILLVITTHVGGMFPEMPYPVKKLTNFGWHGVQLFFLASALTLLMSWHRTRVHDNIFVRSFFIRRFMRIAPMYYVGALIYFLAEPPDTGFSLQQLLLSFTFLNAWRPEWIPTTGGWMVVPGGWSISVEFTFYALFPVLAALVTSMYRAFALVVVAILFACLSNYLAASWLVDYSTPALRSFLYFWFPNQVPVFALGFVLYFIINSGHVPTLGKPTAYTVFFCIAVIFIVLTQIPAKSDRFMLTNPFPPVFLASLGFMVFIFTLARQSNLLVAHPFIQKIGVLSFSAYVLHFFFIHAIPGWSGGWININATGYGAIGTLVLLWVLVLPATLASAALAHVVIEQPGIEMARKMISWRKRSAIQKA